MKCVTREDGKDILEEIHKGICGNHASSRTIVGKAFRAGFYWPIALANAEELVQRCQGCQFFAKQQHVHTYKLITIPPTWPFACWGLNMIGPLKCAPGGFEYIYVAIDMFTKWIEYKPLVKFNATKAVKFMQDIMYRFGMPNRIITDLGSPFTAIEFRSWAQDCGISIDYASIAHPQANDQVERASGLLLARLKPRLFDELKDYGDK